MSTFICSIAIIALKLIKSSDVFETVYNVLYIVTRNLDSLDNKILSEANFLN